MKEVRIQDELKEENLFLPSVINFADPHNLWREFKRIAAFYANYKNFQLSKAFYDKAINAFPVDNKDTDSKGKLYILRGGILKNLGCDYYDDAIASIFKGLDFIDNDNDHMKADAYYNLACIYAKQDEREKYDDIVCNKLPHIDSLEANIAKRRLDEWLNKYSVDYVGK